MTNDTPISDVSQSNIIAKIDLWRAITIHKSTGTYVITLEESHVISYVLLVKSGFYAYSFETVYS